MPDIHMPDEVAEDRKLVAAILLNSDPAFRRFMERFDPVLREAVRTVVPVRLVEDAVQATLEHLFAREWRVLRLWQQQEPLKHYLWTVAKHRSVDLWRQEPKGSSHAPLEDVAEEHLQVEGEQERTVDTRQAADCLRKAGAWLSPADQAILHLRHDEQLDYRSIAERLGRNVNYVGVTLSRAEKALRRRLVSVCRQLLNDLLGSGVTS